MTETKVKVKEVEIRGGQEGRKCHLEGGTLLTARVMAVCCDVIKIYGSTSCIEGVKGLRAQSIYLCSKNSENNVK
jgi:hypothetical protein